jgi:phenylpyruvate tautomerase PptA (4-oxalocrotonate tautomerase family)
MPLVRITVRDDTPPDTRRAIADGVHRGMVAAIGIPEGDRFQVIDQRPAESIIADPEYLGVQRRDVVFVEISLVRGRTVEKKKALYRAVADELVAVGVRGDDVLIVLHETSREDWSFGNGEAQVLDEELLRRYGWTPPSA